MGNEKELIEMLGELVQIVNVRMEAYARAMDELQLPQGNDTVRVLMERIPESKVLRNEIITSITQLGGTRVAGSEKMIFPDHAAAILEVCEDIELTAMKAYDEALARRTAWPEEIFVMLARHRYILKIAHDVIHSFRNTLAHQNM